VSTDAIEVTGYPELARRYRVSSVPKTVVGDGGVEFVGAGPEAMLLRHLQEAAGRGNPVTAGSEPGATVGPAQLALQRDGLRGSLGRSDQGIESARGTSLQ
jgi:hypothetical protein